MAIDRQHRWLRSVTVRRAGHAALQTCVPAPAAFASSNTDCLEAGQMAGAEALLAIRLAGGRAPYGVRAKDGVELEILYLTFDLVRRAPELPQALIKQMVRPSSAPRWSWRNVSASVFFGGDAGTA